MKKEIEERTIKVSVIVFEDGTRIDCKVLWNFLLNQAVDFEDTIGKEGNYTNEYLYFLGKEEKELEEILFKHNVIRPASNRVYHNDRVRAGEKYYGEIHYWLDHGYYNFRDKFLKAIKEI